MPRAILIVTAVAAVLPVFHLGCVAAERGQPVVTAPSQIQADASILVRGIT
ncbi:MAG: hypothetical protein IID40_10675 [Planctomycetes bacterium]|nr:hypothetical protein [Planctomycetota bacterium]